MFIFLLVFIGGLAIFNPFLSTEVKAHFYSLSLAIKSILMTALPFIIMSLLFQAALKMAKNATSMVLFILLGVCCSNFISTWLSYCVGNLVFTFDLSLSIPKSAHELQPLWTFELPKLIANNHAMFLGLFLGVIGSFYEKSEKIAHLAGSFVHSFLKKFQYLIPFFIGGFFVKMMHDGIIGMLVKNYSFILIWIILSQFGWISFLYMVGSRFRLSLALDKIKNMLPAAFAGFSTMSSAAAIPLTLLGTEKNTQYSEFGKSVIPATVNIHLIGDCFAIPIFAFAILKTYGMACPSFVDYLYFSFYFVIAKFSVAAIPGGGIIVMLPILEKYLGFSTPMSSLITALYVLFDPVITSANVFGNGAFAIILDKILKKIKKS